MAEWGTAGRTPILGGPAAGGAVLTITSEMRLSPAAAFGAGTVGGFVCGFQVASTIYSTEAERASVMKAVKVVSASFAVVLLAVGARQVMKN